MNYNVTIRRSVDLIQRRVSDARHILPIVIAGSIFVGAAFSQSPDPAAWQSKLQFHAENAFGLDALAESAVYDGYRHLTDFPREWGQGAAGYGRRAASTLAYSGIRNALAFGLDTALHQDPRYYRSGDIGLWRRTKHAIRGTILAHTDSGGETLATWRFGSAYGAALISNEWYPDRLNTMKVGMEQGSTQIAFDLLANLRIEFWPDLKKKLFHKP